MKVKLISLIVIILFNSESLYSQFLTKDSLDLENLILSEIENTNDCKINYYVTNQKLYYDTCNNKIVYGPFKYIQVFNFSIINAYSKTDSITRHKILLKLLNSDSMKVSLSTHILLLFLNSIPIDSVDLEYINCDKWNTTYRNKSIEYWKLILKL